MMKLPVCNCCCSPAELKRKPSLHVVLPKFGTQTHGGSSDSLNRSPHSPGSILGEEQTEDKELSYKVQRKNYRREKQRVAQELTFALKDPSIIILTGSLKVRGKLKGWTKLLAVLKPGLLLLYKGKVKSSHWVATVLLHCCKLIERPSKKEGFCFKVFHPLDQSIWATKGPNGETIGAVVQPLPTSYLICRAASADEGKCWMDGLELALTCSSLLVRSPRTSEIMDSDKISTEMENDMDWGASDMEETSRVRSDSEKSDSDTSHVEENHAHDFSEEDAETPELGSRNSDVGCCGEGTGLKTQVFADDPITSHGVRQRRKKSEVVNELPTAEIAPVESNYVSRLETDFYHSTGEQEEVLGDENRSLLWFLVKQVRPGMDLSRVVLPTFILEPRSFLEKLSDYYYHADLLSNAVQENDAYLRMQSVLRWYLSGFYKKPKGLKKPYNPILGETYRCCWEHPNGSRTFYLAEQVSHHPPISAFYVSNKKDGYVISSAILAKSKFYGNSTSAILDGQATLTMLPRGETYVITMPYAHCKGILVGTLSMELGGNVSIICEKTGYFTELEFKLKGFLGRADSTNAVYGKIKLGRETISTVEGHWDSKITLKNKRNGTEEILWEVTDSVRAQRLKRFTIPLEEQLPNESEKKWAKVTEAIGAENQEAATLEKTALEDEQRRAVAMRADAGTTWLPNHFLYDGATWRYRHEDLRPWDDGNDLKEYEHDYMVGVHRRHQTPIMRTSSLISVESKVKTCLANNVENTTEGQETDPLFGLMKNLTLTASDEESVEQEQVFYYYIWFASFFIFASYAAFHFFSKPITFNFFFIHSLGALGSNVWWRH
ncbi:unnamed protein product [Orchesella dallaii]|uniref:Oxysterol-binding protein n=1 Tax=Orchesella dallaii TaxID=48710 RepID=A0ABP1QJU2_9HEXA